jgi:hypothetical protein
MFMSHALPPADEVASVGEAGYRPRRAAIVPVTSSMCCKRAYTTRRVDPTIPAALNGSQNRLQNSSVSTWGCSLSAAFFLSPLKKGESTSRVMGRPTGPTIVTDAPTLTGTWSRHTVKMFFGTSTCSRDAS